MKNVLKRFVKDDSGLELVEYALMLALLIVGLALASNRLRTAIGNVWTSAADTVDPQ